MWLKVTCTPPLCLPSEDMSGFEASIVFICPQCLGCRHICYLPRGRGKGDMWVTLDCTGVTEHVQSIASLSLSSRSCGCISASRDCEANIREDVNGVYWGSSSSGEDNDGCLYGVGPDACRDCRTHGWTWKKKSAPSRASCVDGKTLSRLSTHPHG